MFKNENGVGVSVVGFGGFVKLKDGVEGFVRFGGGVLELNIVVCGVLNENGFFFVFFCDGVWVGVGVGVGVGFELKFVKGVGVGIVVVGVGVVGCLKGLLVWGGG